MAEAMNTWNYMGMGGGISAFPYFTAMGRKFLVEVESK